MKINVKYLPKDQSVEITFYTESFKGKGDYLTAMSIVQTFSADFSLDPEIEFEDMENIIKRTLELENDHFRFVINEDEIEVELE